MADVHEELQLGLAHLLGVDVLLQQEVVLLFFLAVLDVEVYQGEEHEEVDQSGPGAGIPGVVDDDGEIFDVRFLAVFDGFNLEFVCAG